MGITPISYSELYIYDLLRPKYNRVSLLTSKLTNDYPGNSFFYYNDSTGQEWLNYTPTTKGNNLAGVVKVSHNNSSVNENLAFSVVVIILFIAGFLIFLFATFKLVKFITHKLFAYRAIIGLDSKDNQTILSKMKGSKCNFYIWSPPNNGLDAYLKRQKNYESVDLAEVDLSTHSIDFDLLKKRKRRLIIHYFERDTRDYTCMDQKLSLLEEAIGRQIKFSIVSAFDLDGIDRIIQSKTKSDPDNDWQGIRYRLRIIRRSFLELYWSIHDLDSQKSFHLVLPDSLKQRQLTEEESKNWNKLKEELEGFYFLNNVKTLTNSLIEEIEDLSDRTYEELVLRIQELSQNYYFSLWHSCSDEEKFILYDLAQDGYVNTKNTQVIMKLVRKGLLKNEMTLEFMNQSFQNYILTVVKPVEIKRMEKTIRTRGAWSKAQIPIFLVIMAIAAFLFITQEAVYQKAIAFLSTLLALLPALLRFIPTSASAITPREVPNADA